MSRADDSTLTSYKDILIDSYALDDHFNIIRLLRSDEYIEKKLKGLNATTYTLKAIPSIYKKIKLVRDLEKFYHLKQFDFSFGSNEGVEPMGNDLFKLIKKIFNSSKGVPGTRDDLKKLYISMIKHIATNDIITSSSEKEKDKDGKRGYIYINWTRS